MKKLLITGFEPFGGEKINPSWEAVKLLPDVIGDFELTKIEIPVVFGKAAETVIKKAEEIIPDAIICVGQAGGRTGVTPEMVAINLRFASIPDNEGNQPKDVPCVECGENAYFSTLPVRKITSAISEADIPCSVSYSAGTYVCNDLIYHVLHRYKGTETKACFIHVPFIPEQTNDKPSLPLETIAKALEIAIETI
ncbi:MAG: pyroglutamyl-peptidase I [Oscillospiraceae bacterium]|nr:pyroglutamyl-peptidase I [Oscillospiraceae bacterium]